MCCLLSEKKGGLARNVAESEKILLVENVFKVFELIWITTKVQQGRYILNQLLFARFKEGIHQTDYQKETALVPLTKRSLPSQNRYEPAQILLLDGVANGSDCSEDEREDLLRIVVRLGDLNSADS